jgi:AraC-like DNA-binding protein
LPPKPGRLDARRWLTLLANPRTQIDIDFHATPPRMTAPVHWDTGRQRIPEHLLYFMLEGGCAAMLEGKRLWPPVGSLCWVSPGTTFRFFARAGDPPPVICRFRFIVRQNKRSFCCRWPYRFLPEAWPLAELVRQIILEKERPGEFGSWRLRDLLSLLSIAVFESQPAPRRRPRLSDAQRASLADLLAAHPGARRTPAELARHLGYSPDYFARLFRRSHGMAPRGWLLEQRLRQGAALLRESSIPVGEVAAKLGYEEVYLFSRQFHRMFGMSASRWRLAG